MTELIKKYATLLIIGLVLSRVIAAIILLAIPNLLTSELPDGGTSTLGTDYLSGGIGYLINIGFIILLSKEMKKEQIKSNLILIMTFFSSLIGVLIFLLSVAQEKYNQPKIGINE
ncbi:hypothetical protein [Croceitalea vernalis]|uniref:DUF4345 domain-containing protein n=1 Tax=Croceitalea vernalis TaxID=3075599 RepID=A0ABU3BIL9_9FLAO|nr:hypothetical protein [Croceitalea sp. P007]MDT0622025.1 hypothetical protein [Croceitalea sp. P007]